MWVRTVALDSSFSLTHFIRTVDPHSIELAIWRQVSAVLHHAVPCKRTSWQLVCFVVPGHSVVLSCVGYRINTWKQIWHEKRVCGGDHHQQASEYCHKNVSETCRNLNLKRQKTLDDILSRGEDKRRSCEAVSEPCSWEQLAFLYEEILFVQISNILRRNMEILTVENLISLEQENQLNMRRG